MLDIYEIAGQLRACANGLLPIQDFEEWFDSTSWNVHQLNNQVLTDAVFQVEALFSDADAGRIDKPAILNSFRELANAICPSAPSGNGADRSDSTKSLLVRKN